MCAGAASRSRQGRLPARVRRGERPTARIALREAERELGLLSDNLRVAYDLVKLRGRSYADASAELGAPVDALKQRVHRASEELRASVTLFLEAS